MRTADTRQLSKEETAVLFEEYAATRDSAIRQKLIEAHEHMIGFFVKRFGGGSDIAEDIGQVANLGLINAVDRYDPSRHVEFSTFATITIMGEIKRFFRDKTWSIKVPRRIKDLNVMINHAIEHLAAKLDHAPTVEEIAQEVGCSPEEVIEATDALQSYHVVSLDKEIDHEASDSATTLSDFIGNIDRRIDMLSDRLSLQSALRQLKEDEKVVIYNRYFGNLSQAQIAKMMNVSQMQISRLQALALKKLKTFLSKE